MNDTRCAITVALILTTACGSQGSADAGLCEIDNGGCGDAAHTLCVKVDDSQVRCVDVDECAIDNGGCGDAASYACVNNDGAPPTCSEIDTCADWQPTANVTRPFQLHVPKRAEIGQVIEFSLSETAHESLDDYDVTWFVDEPHQQQPVMLGPRISYSYPVPSRYRIVSTATPKHDGEQVQLIGYVDVARPYERTIYAVRDTEFDAQDVQRMGHPGATSWCAGSYDVYFGKYFEYWNQRGIETERHHIVQVLALADTLFETFGAQFGWDYRADAGPRFVACSDVTHAGAGPEGMFVSGWHTRIGEPIKHGLLGAMAHELVHLWDFRGAVHFQGPDTGHPLTTLMERSGLGQNDWSYLALRTGSETPVPAAVHDRAVAHYALKRYLENDGLSWETYFSDDILATPDAELWESLPLPEKNERLVVQAGWLFAVRDMHGPQVLKAYFQQIDRRLAREPAWETGARVVELPPEVRVANMVTALADALRLDVAPYFDYWKVPLTPELRDYTAQHPRSLMLEDSDGDGVTPLEGDLDDCDPSVYPGAPELADGKDNNQEGQVDENVYDESVLGGFAGQAIDVPARIVGEITDVDDVDELRLTLPAGTKMAIVIHPGAAPASVPYSADNPRAVSVYSGSLHFGDLRIGVLRDWHNGEGHTVVVDGDGTEMSIRLDALDTARANGNPGKYELQLIPAGYVGAPWDTETLLGSLY